MLKWGCVVISTIFWLSATGVGGLAQDAGTTAQTPPVNPLQAGWNEAVSNFVAFLPNLALALSILILGWLVAWLFGKGVEKLVRSSKIKDKLEEKDRQYWEEASRSFGRLTFWVLMLFVFVGFFGALQFEMITGPINTLLNQLFIYLPQVIGGGLILVLAWILAMVLRSVINGVVKSRGITKPLEDSDAPETKMVNNQTLGHLVYWIVMLFGVVGALNALQMDAITDPLKNMLGLVLAYLPNIVGAALILLAGMFVARLLRQAVVKILSSTRVDSWSEKAGVDRALGSQSLSQLLGLIVYILIVIPVLIAALGVLQINALTEPAMQMLQLALEAIPKLFAAAIILTIAYFIARILEELTVNLLTGVGFDRLPEKLSFREEQLPERLPTLSQMVGKIVLIAIMLLALMQAAQTVGFADLTAILHTFIEFGANVLLALVIVGVGLYFARIARDAVRAVLGEDRGHWWGICAQVAVIVFALALALPLMGVPDVIVMLAFGLPLLALGIAVAIAFGVGGRELATQKLSQWFKRD